MNLITKGTQLDSELRPLSFSPGGCKAGS